MRIMPFANHFHGLDLGPARLAVRSLARTAPFYRDVLGLAALEQTDDAIGFGLLSDRKVLVFLEEGPLALPHPRNVGLFHLAMRLPNRAALGKFALHLAMDAVPFTTGDHGVSEALYLDDPEGNGWEVYADRPVAQWPRATPPDTVGMYTAPVGLPGLWKAAAEADCAQWLAPGTRLGHVHLQVDSLERARALFADALGATVSMRSIPGALFFAWAGYHHQFAANIWHARRATGTATHGLISVQITGQAEGASTDIQALRFAPDGRLELHPAL